VIINGVLKKRMQKISPFLWFNGDAEEAVNYYLGIFKDGKITQVTPYSKAGPGPEGEIMLVAFELYGQPFFALNGGPEFTFTPALSLYVNCQDQAEVDHLWDSLQADGESLQCGWVKDKYGVAWQIVPDILPGLLNDPDKNKSTAAAAAMLKMNKLDIKALKAATGQDYNE
jgi:predicted 3-demethylubiquinone-9 3-methyltransferase (glyoxalase superfamily)